MKEIKRYTLINHDIRASEHECGELVRFTDYEKLQARIKELESEDHINKIKAQGIEWAVEFASFDCTVYDDPVCVLERVEKYAEQLRAKHE